MNFHLNNHSGDSRRILLNNIQDWAQYPWPCQDPALSSCFIMFRRVAQQMLLYLQHKFLQGRHVSRKWLLCTIFICRMQHDGGVKNKHLFTVTIKNGFQLFNKRNAWQSANSSCFPWNRLSFITTSIWQVEKKKK